MGERDEPHSYSEALSLGDGLLPPHHGGSDGGEDGGEDGGGDGSGGNSPSRQGAETEFCPPNWSFAMAAALEPFSYRDLFP